MKIYWSNILLECSEKCDGLTIFPGNRMAKVPRPAALYYELPPRDCYTPQPASLPLLSFCVLCENDRDLHQLGWWPTNRQMKAPHELEFSHIFFLLLICPFSVYNYYKKCSEYLFFLVLPAPVEFMLHIYYAMNSLEQWNSNSMCITHIFFKNIYK